MPTPTLTIGLVGDRDEQKPAHRAIPLAIPMAAEALGVEARVVWLPTEGIGPDWRPSGLSGLWCVPGSPYRSMDGALHAVRLAREQGLPFLGTCGGFQHAVVEYARNVLGWSDAEHAETAPEAERAVISLLACALVEVRGPVRLLPGSRIAAAYGSHEAVEGYRCSYGLNPAFLPRITAGPLRLTAVDEVGEARAVELDGHPFFLATLFQPERAALEGRTPPLVVALLRACLALGRSPGPA